MEGIGIIRLRPFKRIDAEKLLSWLTDERVMTMWCAKTFTYPLTQEQIITRMKEREEADDEWVMAGVDAQGEVIGHFCIWADYQKNSAHLGMIVVDDARRGQGLGQQMVELAVKYAFDILHVLKVTLGVFDCNPRAHACYQKVGFRDDKIEDHAMKYHGEIWNRIHMVMERED